MRFVLRDGRAAYRNRYVRTAGADGRDEGRARRSTAGLLEQPRDCLLTMPPSDAAKYQHHRYANRMLALWEADYAWLKPETLETVGMYDFGGKLNGPMTAHPKFDPVTGDLLFFGYQPFPPYVTCTAPPRWKVIESRESIRDCDDDCTILS